MDRRSKLVAAALLASAGASHAFISPSPPAGFGGTPGNWTHTPPTAAQQLGSIMRGPGPKIPNGPVTNGAFRIGAGGARALAGAAARLAIPGVGLALGIAWLASQCYERQGGQWVRTCGGNTPPQSDGNEWAYSSSGPWYSSRGSACTAYAGFRNSTSTTLTFTINNADEGGPAITNYRCRLNQFWKTGPNAGQANGTDATPYEVRGSACPAGWYITPAGCVQTPPPQVVTPEEIEEDMATKPLPQTLPPGVPYPLDPLAPFIFEPDAANPPNPQPLWVPQGNPVPIPNTNPQQYRQPVTRFDPAPTTDDPFRLDGRPEEIVGTSPTGMTGPQTGQSGQPPGEKPEQFDLCKEHPDIIACQVFKPDELTPMPMPNKEVPLALNAEGGFPTGGSCPQPKVLTLMGKSFAFSMQPLCDFALGIKPLLIGFAWLSAALVFLGVARREN